MSKAGSATVAILTFNGEKYLRGILEAVSAQDFDGDVEILVIDSGSTDSTLEIVASFPHVRLHCIPNEEFGHGKTRNLAAQLGTGEFIAFLTHDAIPITEFWLREMVAPFSLNERIVAVMGRQIPRASAAPITKYEINRVFAQFGTDLGTTVFQDDGRPEHARLRDGVTFFSDVNSASRREFLVKTIPYQDVRYAEDQKYGQDLIAAGFWKAYSARAAVEHSNDLTVREFGPRTFDEITGLRQLGAEIPVPSQKSILRSVLQGSWSDLQGIRHDREYSWKRRLYWVMINPWLHVAKWSAVRRAALTDITQADLVAEGSLESRRKSSS
jgi:rhamnosyltransferase